MLKAPVAPFALVAIVRCLRSQTTVDAGRCSQCRPSNIHQQEDNNLEDEEKKDDVGGHQEEDKDDLKKRAVMETLLKNLIARTPEQVSLDGRWSRRPALPTLRACRELGRGSSKATRQRLVRCVYEKD
jgi:hypothetical protein